jgi:hypothetical protein
MASASIQVDIVTQPGDLIFQMVRNTSLLLDYVAEHGYKQLEQLLGPLEDHRLIHWEHTLRNTDRKAWQYFSQMSTTYSYEDGRIGTEKSLLVNN